MNFDICVWTSPCQCYIDIFSESNYDVKHQCLWNFVKCTKCGCSTCLLRIGYSISREKKTPQLFLGRLHSNDAFFFVFTFASCFGCVECKLLFAHLPFMLVDQGR